MARFELNIYGANDEIEKTYATDHVRWGTVMCAAKLQKGMAGIGPVEQMEAIGDVVKKLFPDLTDEDLDKADRDDLFNLLAQITNSTKRVGEASKNGEGEA